jgi:hypothetical protein
MIAVAAAGVVAAGCGEKKPEPAAAPVLHHLEVTASDFAFQMADSTPAGLTHVMLKNAGPGFHHVQFVKLDSGKTVTDLTAAMKNPGPPPAWATFVAGPNPVGPGAQTTSSVELTAGNYAVLCLVDVPDNMPHFTKGMVHALKVTPSASPSAAAPNADVTITLSDYNFGGTDSLKAGKHTFAVKNAGPQPHEVFLVRFAPGKGMKELGAWFSSMKGPPPAEALGGTSVEASGLTAYFDADLTPGDYAFLCFVPDGKDGKPHMEHGMVKTFKIG